MSKQVRTWTVLSLVGAALACGQVAVAQQELDWSKVQIKTTKVSGNVYMLEGQGGNIAASVGEDGIVIVDDQFAPLAEKIQAALKELKITDKPVRFVINTHFHGDHTGGNVPFNNAGSTLIAQDNVRKRLESGGTVGNGSSIKADVKPAAKAALPIITFEHDVTVHLNGEDIRALHFPSGHTDGDSIIFFPKNNIVHMGDDFVRYGFPFIDVASGGSVQGMIDAMEKATAQLPADVKVIPGHGALESRRRPRLHKDAQGNFRRRPESPHRSQNVGSDEEGQNSRALGEMERRFRQRRRLYRDALQFLNRPQRRIRKAQLKKANGAQLSANVEAGLQPGLTSKAGLRPFN